MMVAARVLAFAVAVPTLLSMMRPDRWGMHHLFFVPDLILVVVLAVAALIPGPRARAMLIIAYAFAAGVTVVASFSYVARGAAADGWLTMVTAAGCAAMAILLSFPERRREAAA